MMRIKREYFESILCILLMCIGATNRYLTYVMIVSVVFVAIHMGMSYIKFPNVDCCKGIVLLLVFQNLVIGIGAHLTNNMSSNLNLLTQVPFMIIAIQWFALLFLKRRKEPNIIKQRMLFVLLLCLVLFSLVNGIGTINSMLINIRNLTVFYMAYELGEYNITSYDDLYKFEKFLFRIGVFVLIAGVILLIGGYKLYEIIGIKEVYMAKGSPLQAEALDNRFTTSLISREFNRMGSVFYEPVNLGYFFSCLTLTSWFNDWEKNYTKKYIYFALMLLGLVLSFGKGGYLITLVVVVYVYSQRVLGSLKKQLGKKLYRRLGIFLIIMATVFFCIYYYINIGAAVSPHFWGIMQTWQSVLNRPLGYGLGTGGNAALIFGSNISWYASGGETQLMSFIYQIGVQGGILFIICVLKTGLSSGYKINKGDEMFVVLPTVLLLMSLLQDNTFTPQCIVLFMMIQGSINRIYR